MLLAATTLLQRRCPAPLMAIEEENEFDITLSKPLGIAFEESSGVGGLEVKRLLSGGSAAASTFVWPGDVLTKVGSQRIGELSFDASMELLSDAPDSLDLAFHRPLTITALDFPNGKRAFGRKGMELRPLALRMGYTDIEYDCGKGSCGSCERVLHNTASGSCKSVRVCKAKMPAADLCPYELLTPDAEVAQEFFEALAARAAR